MSAIPNDAATAVAIPSLEDLIGEMHRNYPVELRNIRGQLPDGPATQSLKDDSDRMARLSEMAQVELTPARPGDEPRAYIADVAVRGPYVSFVVLDEQGVPSNGAFPLHELDEGADTGSPIIGGTQTPTGGVGASGAVGHGTARVPTSARDGKLQAPPGVPANIDDLDEDEQIELLYHPPEGVDARAVASYLKSSDNPSREVVMTAFDLGLYGPASTVTTPEQSAQGLHPVEGPGTTPGGDNTPGPDTSGAGSSSTTSSGSTSSSGSSSEDTEPDDDVKALTGSELTSAVEAAGIDWKQGGSRADGSLTAREARDALRRKRAAG